MARDHQGVALREIGTLFRWGTLSGASDSVLLDHFLGGCPDLAEAAFTVLVLRHGPMVHRVCLGVLRVNQDAEDAAQATFLALLKSASRVQKRESIASWLHGTALRVSVCLRKARVRKERHEAKASSLRVWMEAEEEPVPADLVATIHHEIGKLPEAYRTVIVLCDLEGFTYEEAAKRVDRPVGTIKSRVFRARERLKAKLIRRGLSPAVGIATILAQNEASASVLLSWANVVYRLATNSEAVGDLTRILSLRNLYQRSLLMSYLKSGIASLTIVGILTAGATLWAQQGKGAGGGSGLAAANFGGAAAAQSVVKVYHVADLVSLQQTLPVNQRPTIDLKPLMEIIATTVAPGSWCSNEGDQGWISEQPIAGGRVPDLGSIVPANGKLTLVIRHSSEVHEQIKLRLEQLRHLTEARDNTVVQREENQRLPNPNAPNSGRAMMGMMSGMMGAGGAAAAPEKPAAAGRPGMMMQGASSAGMGGMMGGSGSSPAQPAVEKFSGAGMPPALPALPGQPNRINPESVGMMPGMGKAPQNAGGDNDDTKQRLRSLEEKLDRLINALETQKATGSGTGNRR